VLDITEFYGPTSGGIRTYVGQKAQWLRTQEWARQVIVVPGARDLVEDDPSGGSRRYELRGPPVPGQAPYRFFLATRTTPRIVRHERPDVIELGSPGLVPWIAARAQRGMDVPMISFFHSNFPRIYNPFPERSGGLKRLTTDLLWRYVKFIDRFSRVTIACSDFAAEDLRRAGIDRVVRLPLGVDLELFHPRRRSQRDEARARYGLPRNAPLAAYIGRFANEKEIGTLLEGWEQAYRRTGMHLALIGDGPIRAALERWTRDHAWAHLVPYEQDRTRLAELHAALDLYAAPGPVETFGLSGLEALASGTPVVSVHRGGVAEQVTASGAGRLYQAGRPETVAPAVEAVLAADRAELARLGRAHAERDHSWDVVFTRLFALYDRVLAGEFA
jgi:alpha-1,6-mannosyltransferase